MCLIVNREIKIDIAQEDIVCYKVLTKHWKHQKFIKSPYQGFIYEIEKEYKTRMKPFCNGICYKITEGFHSFLNEEAAKSEKRWLQAYNFNDKTWDLCCFRCIIPKGTKVVYGKYNEKDAIVSEAIKIMEEV